MRKWKCGAVLAGLFLGVTCGGNGASGTGLPVNRELLESRSSGKERARIENLLSLDQLRSAVVRGDEDLRVDFSSVHLLLDGEEIDPAKIYGTVYAGPYPFEGDEASFAYKRFRSRHRLQEGKGRLGASAVLEPRYDSEGWTDRGRLAVRFDLRLEREGADRDLGVYDTFVWFEKTGAGFEPRPSIVEGPFLALGGSDDPGRAAIGFRTSEAVTPRVVLSDGRTFAGRIGTEHEIVVDGLTPGAPYRYRVEVGSITTRSYPFRAAPAPDAGQFSFAYFGDSRAGRGGGMNEFMGVNHQTLVDLTSTAYREGAEFLLMGGDLVNGYTSSPEDFALQFRAWKQAVAGFWNSRPVLPAMGNHEALLRVFDLGDHETAYYDRWPYATESAEAVFANEFLNPRNGPSPSDPRRPTYDENVYTFRYGAVLCVAFNNNYWLGEELPEAGGCPEGYILPDQMEWIEARLDEAERDPSVRFVVLYGQEPVFPNGGHVQDAMWAGGDNRVRASTYREGAVVEEPAGLIDVRNRFVRAVSRSSKAAVVLGADEHGYHRTLIGPDVPIGDPTRDDANGDGVIGWPAEGCSPLEDLPRSTWYVVGAGGGAPYYAEEPSPWNTYWKGREGGEAMFRFTSQENVLLFDVDGRRIGMRVLNPFGEPIDEVPDLMAAR